MATNESKVLEAVSALVREWDRPEPDMDRKSKIERLVGDVVKAGRAFAGNPQPNGQKDINV